MDLYLINQMSVEDIAKIKDLPVSLVENIVRDASDTLRRYLI
jgi:hypothetical protein